jgi:hypothetical protein
MVESRTGHTPRWPPEAIGMAAHNRILHEDLVRLAEGVIRVSGLANQPLETHQALIRLAKGMILAYEKWLNER